MKRTRHFLFVACYLVFFLIVTSCQESDDEADAPAIEASPASTAASTSTVPPGNEGGTWNST